MNNKRKIFFRIAAVLVLVLISVWMMIIGRGHTVYFDNKDFDYEGETYAAPYKIEVEVNGANVAKLKADDRGMATWIGQNFKMKLFITAEKGGETLEEEYSVKLPYNLDGIVFNLQGLRAGLPQESWQSEFVSLAISSGSDEEVVLEEDFGMGDI